MTVKPGAKTFSVKEQIVEDPASGLTFQFLVMPDGKSRFRVYGNLPLGNREIVFDVNGEEAGAGTALTGLCKATWINES